MNAILFTGNIVLKERNQILAKTAFRSILILKKRIYRVSIYKTACEVYMTGRSKGKKPNLQGKKLTETQYRLLLNNMISPFSYYRMIYDENGKAVDYIFLAVNKAFEKETGLKRRQLIGKRVLEVYPSTEQYWIEVFGEIGKTRIPKRLNNYSSALNKWYEINAYSPKKEHVAITVTDVSDSVALKKNREEVYRLAYTDTNTGLPNQNMLMETLDVYIGRDEKQEQELALIYILLNGFDDICASYGCFAGNLILVETAKRILSRECPSCKAYYYNGPGFILLVDMKNACRTVQETIESILEDLSKPMDIQGNYHRIGANCGIAFYPKNGSDFNTLLMQAITALFWAKRSGEGTYASFNQSMSEELVKKTQIRNYLRKALENQEFYLEYQPQIDARTKEITGFEALIRWNSPEMGVMQPNTFIAIAEKTGLIISIGDWVLAQACQDMKKINEQNHTSFTVAVNVSVVQVLNDSYVSRVLNTLSQVRFPLNQLELEVTETLFMDHDSRAITRMNQLHDHGIRIALDDFGTGYSSLSTINDLKLNTIKIDKSLIKRSDVQELTTMMIHMGHMMRLEIVAEGVETEMEMKELEEAGCDRLQGFLFSKPIPFEEVGPFIQKYYKTRF